ncbi:MAG: uracil-DNA glycosylase family protein [Pyrinomonadaceae bacterium]
MQAGLFAAGAGGPSGETIASIEDDIRQRIAPLFPGRAFVFGLGPQDAAVVAVGESPGPPDLATGQPFTGPAGDLLKRILASIGLGRSDCYLTNVVKFISQGDELTPETIDLFTPFLRREIAAISPEVVLLLGSTPTRALLNTKQPISKARGEFTIIDGIAYMPTFNPAYLLRDPTKKKEVWDDIKKVREFLSRLG